MPFLVGFGGWWSLKSFYAAAQRSRPSLSPKSHKSRPCFPSPTPRSHKSRPCFASPTPRSQPFFAESDLPSPMPVTSHALLCRARRPEVTSHALVCCASRPEVMTPIAQKSQVTPRFTRSRRPKVTSHAPLSPIPTPRSHALLSCARTPTVANRTRSDALLSRSRSLDSEVTSHALFESQVANFFPAEVTPFWFRGCLCRTAFVRQECTMCPRGPGPRPRKSGGHGGSWG